MVSVESDERVGGLVEDRASLLDVVAVEADDERLGCRVAERLQSALTMPLATASHAVIPPKTLTKTDLTCGIAEDDVEAVGHDLGRGAAADVEEVRRLHAAVLLTGVGDDVEGRHDEACAVADDADLDRRA